jgi:hypothetical protein
MCIAMFRVRLSIAALWDPPQRADDEQPGAMLGRDLPAAVCTESVQHQSELAAQMSRRHIRAKGIA